MKLLKTEVFIINDYDEYVYTTFEEAEQASAEIQRISHFSVDEIRNVHDFGQHMYDKGSDNASWS